MKKIFILYLVFSFIANFLWEISQVNLYTLHSNGTLDLIFVHLNATMGDVVIFFIIYAFVGIITRDALWIAKDKPISLMLVSILGFIFAVAIEKYALATDRWSYSEIMPIIPYIKVGLIPVLQMTILAPFVAFTTGRYSMKIIT